jgi:DNA-binding transcriptional regulator YhcF (GntR family)
MATDRAEPFQVALASLRDRLREGRLAPGERISPAAIAADLELSQTPLREALSRLAGEGLLEDRRGRGFFVRSLAAVDIADLYRISAAHLAIVHDPHRRAIRRSALAQSTAVVVKTTDPVREVERLFAQWIVEEGSWALVAAHDAIQIQLGPVRRVEHGVFDDLAAEARELEVLGLQDPGGAWGMAVRRFHSRRIAVADRLAALLQRGR